MQSKQTRLVLWSNLQEFLFGYWSDIHLRCTTGFIGLLRYQEYKYLIETHFNIWVYQEFVRGTWMFACSCCIYVNLQQNKKRNQTYEIFRLIRSMNISSANVQIRHRCFEQHPRCQIQQPLRNMASLRCHIRHPLTSKGSQGGAPTIITLLDNFSMFTHINSYLYSVHYIRYKKNPWISSVKYLIRAAYQITLFSSIFKMNCRPIFFSNRLKCVIYLWRLDFPCPVHRVTLYMEQSYFLKCTIVVEYNFILCLYNNEIGINYYTTG